MERIKILNKIQYIGREHHKYLTPALCVFSIAALAAVSIFIGLSILQRPDGTHFYYNFAEEQGSITILSGASLATAALLAFICVFVTPATEKRQRIFFLIVALALTYLAVDEVMQFHETYGSLIDKYRSMRKIRHWLNVRTWNDMIIIIYGLAAIPVALYFLPTAVKIPFIPEYFLAAFICYCVHTLVDSYAEPPTTISYILEESMKVYTSAFLALGLVSGLVFLIKKRVSSS